MASGTTASWTCSLRRRTRYWTRYVLVPALTQILFALDDYHLDVIFFAILVIFVAWTCMQGQIVAGARFFLGEISTVAVTRVPNDSRCG